MFDESHSVGFFTVVRSQKANCFRSGQPRGELLIRTSRVLRLAHRRGLAAQSRCRALREKVVPASRFLLAINGERNPEALAASPRIAALQDPATHGRSDGPLEGSPSVHGPPASDQIDAHTAVFATLTGRIEEAVTPFRAAKEVLARHPGVSLKVAQVIIVETGADMAVFETPGRLVSWTGASHGPNESAGGIGACASCTQQIPQSNPGHRGLSASLGRDSIFEPNSGAFPPGRSDESHRRPRTLHPHRSLAHAHRGECYADPARTISPAWTR